MRYLVKVRVQQGFEAALRQAVTDGLLSQGSVADRCSL